MLVWTLIIITALVALYVVLLRPWLRNREFAKPFFDWIEPVERTLWKKSEGILWARFQQVMGLLIAFLAYIGQLDVTIVAPLVQPEYQPLVPLALNVSGTIAEALRRDTTKPVEVVSAPPTEAVKEAIAKVDEANKEAKAVAAAETVRQS